MTAAGDTRRCRRVVALVLALATAPMLAGCADSTAGRPDVSAALLQFGVAMLQPVPYGQTGLGHAAQALGEAGQAAARVREAEREREQHAPRYSGPAPVRHFQGEGHREFEHALAERRVAAAEKLVESLPRPATMARSPRLTGAGGWLLIFAPTDESFDQAVKENMRGRADHNLPDEERERVAKKLSRLKRLSDGLSPFKPSDTPQDRPDLSYLIQESTKLHHDLEAPLQEWKHLLAFDTALSCETGRRQIRKMESEKAQNLTLLQLVARRLMPSGTVVDLTRCVPATAFYPSQP